MFVRKQLQFFPVVKSGVSQRLENTILYKSIVEDKLCLLDVRNTTLKSNNKPLKNIHL